ncbi:hypothetical protein [Streptomyces sp. ID05-18]|uniref:hypothetical protein n=1 Tax=Streptomyces sp. ID05-18 TaxID=3028662 RepID=UPI00299F93D7|nr:hypothetical protein [Streptomyces sp. ID05-18]MDX3490987.1 hypothetical protein [Streptomyces sp. ID05-18]
MPGLRSELLRPDAELRPQMTRLRLGQQTPVFRLSHGQGVLVPFPFQLGPQRGHVVALAVPVLLAVPVAPGRRIRGGTSGESGPAGVFSRNPAASRPSFTGISQPRASSWTALSKSPASRRRRIVVRLTPHAVAASRRVSIGRVIPLPSLPRPAPPAAPAGPVG